MCVGSIKELEELTGTTVTDLHRESIDHLTIISKKTGNVLKRVDEVRPFFISPQVATAQSREREKEKENKYGPMITKNQALELI